jgi:hypothetical protein
MKTFVAIIIFIASIVSLFAREGDMIDGFWATIALIIIGLVLIAWNGENTGAPIIEEDDEEDDMYY